MIGLLMLVAFLIYVSITVTITRWIIRIPKRRVHKWIVALISLSVFALIPTWDVILGRVYFKYLCETEGGIHVYKTVELGPEYFMEDASPNYFSSTSPNYFFKEHYLDEFVLDNRYIGKSEWDREYSEQFHIAMDSDVILDKTTNEVMGQHISFVYFGGWLVNSTGLLVRGKRCPLYEPSSYTVRFLREIFQQL